MFNQGSSNPPNAPPSFLHYSLRIPTDSTALNVYTTYRNLNFAFGDTFYEASNQGLSIERQGKVACS